MAAPPSRSIVRSVFLAVLLAAFAYLVGLILRPFLTYLLAVLLLAFVLTPFHRRLSARVDARVSALVLVTFAVGGTVAAVALLVMALPVDASALSRGIEREIEQRRLQRQLERVLGTDVPLESLLSDVPRRVADIVVGDLTTLVGAATDAFLGVALVLFVLYYLLVDGGRLVAWVKRVTPLRPEMTDTLFAEAHDTTWAVLKGHVFIAILQGAVAGVGLLVVGIPNVVFWTVVMMFLELFPIVGVAAVLGPATLYLLLVDRLLAAGFLFVYGLTAVAAVDDYLRAMYVDRESSLHSAVILVGVFGGVYAFGVMGLFYGPVVIGLFKTLVQLFDEAYVS
jgi:predicted PurR-regulated permease PerM